MLHHIDRSKPPNIHIYQEMLILMWSNFTEAQKEEVNKNLQWFLDRDYDEQDAIRRCQIAWNHDHLTKKDALRKITQVREIVKKKFPKRARQLEAVWRESDEKDAPVNLSFYLDWL